LTQRPWRELHLRACDKCGVEMLSIYPPHFDRKVYCESCYNKEMYW
jgi:CxxC-x17-CxxC domain-containing protein